MTTARRLQKMQKVLSQRQLDLTVVCENIHDPHNVSAILRSCDAVGIAAIHLIYTSESFPTLGRKSSGSAKKWIEIHRHRSYQGLQRALKKEYSTIYATRLEPSARCIFDIDWTIPAAIIFGNEHRGVSDDAMQIADQSIYIPMYGMVESLNVSVAAAVILYEASRQRLLADQYRRNNDDPWIQAKLEQWTR